MKPFFCTLLLVLTFVSAGCPSSGTKPDGDPNAPSADFLIGRWQDNDSAVFTFEKVGGDVKLTQIVDDDGEVFELRDFGYKAGHFSFTYFVPSTGYVVTIRILTTDGDELDADWVNSANDSGPERLVRLD